MIVAIIHDVAFSLSAFGKSYLVCLTTFLFRPLFEIRRGWAHSRPRPSSLSHGPVKVKSEFVKGSTAT